MRRRRPTTHTLFAGLPIIGSGTPDDLRSVAAAGDLVTVPGGTVLHRRGDHPRACYLLLDGAVHLVDAAGEVEAVGRGVLVGLVEVLDRAMSTVDAVTTTEATLLAITAPRLLALVDRSPAMRAAVLRQLARRTRQLDERLAS